MRGFKYSVFLVVKGCPEESILCNLKTNFKLTKYDIITCNDNIYRVLLVKNRRVYVILMVDKWIGVL